MPASNYGYAMAFDAESKRMYFLNRHSAVRPEDVTGRINEKKRIKFKLFPGGDLKSSACATVEGDVFCADPAMARLVKDAVQEKLSRESAELRRNAFRVFGTDIEKIGDETLMHIAASNLISGSAFSFSLVIQAKKGGLALAHGTRSFTNMCEAVGISNPVDTEQFHGKVLTYVGDLSKCIDFRPYFQGDWA